MALHWPEVNSDTFLLRGSSAGGGVVSLQLFSVTYSTARAARSRAWFASAGASLLCLGNPTKGYLTSSAAAAGGESFRPIFHSTG